jgi:hypothetical protein
MPNEPVSQMIRVPTPLVDAVRELARLHRQGRTKAVLEGIQRLIQAIDSDTDIDIDSVSETISRLSERLDRLEAKQSDSISNIDVDKFACAVFTIDKRLEKVEDDVKSIALTITDLNVRVSDQEGVDDIRNTVTVLSELEASGDISQDSVVTPRQQEVSDISSAICSISKPVGSSDIISDSESTAEAESPSQPQAPLTQKALAARFGASGETIRSFQKKGKESFAEWSRKYDPDGIAWTWEGEGGSGRPLRFLPWSTSPLP